jgi:O-antigen/teichoic acid export membrane protein
MSLVSNIATTLSARVVIMALALLSSIILARVLGPEGRGLFALVLLMPELVRTFGLLGFDHANVVYAGLEPQSCRPLVWQSALLAVIVGGTTAIAAMSYVALGAPGFPELARGPLNLYLIALSIVPAALAIEYWFAILRGTNRIILLNVVDVATKLGGVLVLAILIVWFHLGVFGAILADFVLNIGTLLLLAILLRETNLLGKPKFDRSLFKRTACFALPAYSSTVMSYLNYRVDQFIIAIMLPPEQLGFYVIAVAIAERVWILTGAVGNALLPHLTNSKDRDPAISAVIARHVAIWTGAACLLVFFLADAAIRIMYSSVFADSVAPLQWLLPGIFIASIGKILVGELLAREKVRYLVWITGITAFVNIAGNLLLIPLMGISGAALASTLSYGLLSMMTTRFYVKETNVSPNLLVPRWSDLSIYTRLWNYYGLIALKRSEIARRLP